MLALALKKDLSRVCSRGSKTRQMEKGIMKGKDPKSTLDWNQSGGKII